MLSFKNHFANGQQIALLRDFNQGQIITQDMLNTFYSKDYQEKNPKTVEIFKDLFAAVKKLRTIDGRLISNMTNDEKQMLLKKKIENGRQLAALALIGNGAHLDAQMVEKLRDNDYQRNNVLTSQALRPFLRFFDNNNQAPASLQNTLVDLQNFIVGEGNFIHQERFSHEDIARLKQKNSNNPVLKAAFALVEGLDIAHQNDIMTLSTFLNTHPNTVSAQNVIDLIDDERIKLNRIKTRESLLLPVRDSLEQLLKPSGVLYHAKQMLTRYPELVNGEISAPLSKFKNKELSGLKAALAYAARLKGADNTVFERLKGFYKAKVPHGTSYQSKLLFGDSLYVPASGYILGADQLCANDSNYNQYNPGQKAAITDCSGFMTDIMREVRPELTWLKNHKLVSWDLEKEHDAKYLRRNDIQSQEGPIQATGKRREKMFALEKEKANKWVANHPVEFSTFDQAFTTVKARNDIKPGDFILYRQREKGANCSKDATGHVALVVDYTPGNNNATLLEYTRSGNRDGVGFTHRPVCYGTSGNTMWETRVLRPKLS